MNATTAVKTSGCVAVSLDNDYLLCNGHSDCVLCI